MNPPTMTPLRSGRAFSPAPASTPATRRTCRRGRPRCLREDGGSETRPCRFRTALASAVQLARMRAPDPARMGVALGGQRGSAPPTPGRHGPGASASQVAAASAARRDLAAAQAAGAEFPKRPAAACRSLHPVRPKRAKPSRTVRRSLGVVPRSRHGRAPLAHQPAAIPHPRGWSSRRYSAGSMEVPVASARPPRRAMPRQCRALPQTCPARLMSDERPPRMPRVCTRHAEPSGAEEPRVLGQK